MQILISSKTKLQTETKHKSDALTHYFYQNSHKGKSLFSVQAPMSVLSKLKSKEMLKFNKYAGSPYILSIQTSRTNSCLVEMITKIKLQEVFCRASSPF